MKVDDIITLLEKKPSTIYKSVTKIPKKVKKYASHQSYQDNACVQADLLYLPHDRGFKYLLTCIDTYDNDLDFEPLKARSQNDVLNGFKKIFKRKYLKIPYFLQTDKGSEFGSKITSWFKNRKTYHRISRVGRHNQQAPIEHLNKNIGQILNGIMMNEEITTGNKCNSWVKYIDKLRIVLNKEMHKREPDVFKLSSPYTNCPLFKIGSKVRVKMEQPADYLTGKRLHGKFRVGDLRFEIQPRKITNMFIKPGAPVMYAVDGYSNAFYPEELQQLDEPEEIEANKYVVEKIVGKRKKRGRIEYLIKWLNYDKSKNTWETRKSLVEDGLIQMIKQYLL